jgi:hypothetical protein
MQLDNIARLRGNDRADAPAERAAARRGGGDHPGRDIGEAD